MGGCGGGYGLFFKNGWFVKTFWGMVFTPVVLHNLVKWQYEIPNTFSTNVAFWPWFERRVQLKRMGMDPDKTMTAR